MNKKNPRFNREIQNLKGCHVLVQEVHKATREIDSWNIKRVIHIGNDWNDCLDFEFDNQEQIQTLIELLTDLKERWK